MPIVTLVVATTPALLLSFLFWERCRFAAPAERFWSAFLIGAIMAIPAVALAVLLTVLLIAANDTVGAIAKAFVGAAAPEELAKFAAVTALFCRHDGPRDGAQTVVAAVALAAGFAAIETLLFLGIAEQWGRTAIVRSVTALPAHVFCGAIMGACLARHASSGHRRCWLASALLMPILLHGLYDSFAFLWAAAQTGPSVPTGAVGGENFRQALACGFVLTLLAGGYLAHVLTRPFALGARAGGVLELRSLRVHGILSGAWDHRARLWRFLGGCFPTTGSVIAGFRLGSLVHPGVETRLALSQADGEVLGILGCVSLFYGMLLFAHVRLVGGRGAEG